MSSLLAHSGSGPGLAGHPHPSDHAACVLLQPKKSVVVPETPSAVLPNSDGSLDESVTSKKTDSILRAATQDLLTLMKLDVRDPAASSGWGWWRGASACPGDPVLRSPASSGSCSRVGVAMATPSPGQGSGRRPDGPDAGVRCSADPLPGQSGVLALRVLTGNRAPLTMLTKG